MDKRIGLYDPIINMSGFWLTNEDLILLNRETISRMKKVKAGEKLELEPGITESQIKKLSFDGSLKLSWDSESLFDFMVEQEFSLDTEEEYQFGTYLG